MRLPGRTFRARTPVPGLPLALAGSIALALAPGSAHALPLRDAAGAVPPGPSTGSEAAGARPVDAVPRAAPAYAASAPGEYVVQAGDTVSGIAGRHGLRTADVLAANGLGWSSIIYPGQALRLPAAPTRPALESAPVPASSGIAHTVRAGDTVFGIARSHGLSTQAVLDANRLGPDAIIYPGQTLSIPSAPTPAPAVASPPAPSIEGLDAEQVGNAQLIIRVGRERGVGDRAIAIALGTAMVESWLRNLERGDRDSLGLFQQRPSAGWGTPEQILDPVRSTRAFFGGAGDPNGTRTRGLLDIPGWESMTYAEAAQAVQISAFPDRYARWEQSAARWVSILG